VTDVLGYVAAMLTALAFLPQLLKTLRTRSTADLSAGMLLAQATGVALWFVYGVAIRSAPIIAANAVTFLVTAPLLVFKLTHGTQR